MVSWWGGFFTALLAAASNWAVYLARGTWHPTYIEMGSVAGFVFLVRGIVRVSNRDLIGGVIVALLIAAGDVKSIAVHGNNKIACSMNQANVSEQSIP